MGNSNKVAVTVLKPKGYDHEPSERVSVTDNHEGQFVQVFNRNQSDDGPSRVIFSYQRTPTGVTNVTWRIELNDEPCARVELRGNQCKTVRSDGTTRLEQMLPSGRLLTSDTRLGLRIERTWAAEFNWEKKAPKGGALSDRATMKLQDADLPWFVCLYQTSTAENGEMTKALIAVELHRGKSYLGTKELDSP